jgi:molybdenum cofactor guanylyltransferase
LKFNAIVLAGGKSARMGVDKGLMPLSGKPMISYVLEVLEPLSDRILIVSNQEEYTQFGHPVFKDEYRDKGPLAGIYSGLLNSTTAHNIVVGCDVPFVSEALLNHLIKAHLHFDVTVPIHNGKTEQLMGIYAKNCLPVFQAQIEANELKIKTANRKLKYQEIEIDKRLKFYDPKLFQNVNSPIDFEKATQEKVS